MEVRTSLKYDGHYLIIHVSMIPILNDTTSFPCLSVLPLCFTTIQGSTRTIQGSGAWVGEAFYKSDASWFRNHKDEEPIRVTCHSGTFNPQFRVFITFSSSECSLKNPAQIFHLWPPPAICSSASELSARWPIELPHVWLALCLIDEINMH